MVKCNISLCRNQVHPHRCIRKNNSNCEQLCMHIQIGRSEPNTNKYIPSPFSLLEGYFMGVLLNSFFNIFFLVLDYGLN